MTDTNLLRAKITENGFTQEQIAQKLGISVASLNKRINNKSQFRADEIWELKTILNIKDMVPYFFA